MTLAEQLLPNVSLNQSLLLKDIDGKSYLDYRGLDIRR